jgi:hypothetical protein
MPPPRSMRVAGHVPATTTSEVHPRSPASRRAGVRGRRWLKAASPQTWRRDYG